jgi:hypothetical protein
LDPLSGNSGALQIVVSVVRFGSRAALNAESVCLVGVGKDCAFAYISAIPGWLGWSRERTGVDSMTVVGRLARASGSGMRVRVTVGKASVGQAAPNLHTRASMLAPARPGRWLGGRVSYGYQVI